MKKSYSMSWFTLFILLGQLYFKELQAVVPEENIQVNLSNKADVMSLEQDFADEVKRVTIDLMKQAAIRVGLDQLNTLEYNPNRSVSASVVDRNEVLNAKELDLVDNKTDGGVRLSKVTEAQQNLLGIRVLKKDALRIGVVFSGGGYRAMILSLGYAHALAKMGIWDATSYVSTLSGSTWFLSVLMNVIEKYKTEILGSRIPSLKAFELAIAHFQNKIKTEAFALNSPSNIQNFAKNSLTSFFKNVIAPKILFQQVISSIDLYGGLLAQTLFSDLTEVPLRRTLSEEWESIKTGYWPLPIRSSVTMMNEGNDKYKYHWFEFNPMEVRDCELDLAIPTYSFGRLFKEGKSVSFAPEKKSSSQLPTIMEYGPQERLGELMGIWGSAYNINLQYLKDEMAREASIQSGSSQEGFSLQKDVMQGVLTALEKQLGEKGTVKRFSPAQINNPFVGCGMTNCPKPISSWLSAKPYLTFIDAGIDFNLPLPPLFKEQRELDVIIVGDSSGGELDGAVTPKQLGLFFKYIQESKGLRYERIDDRKNNTISVWEDRLNLKAPMIIYVNFKNDSVLFKKAEQDPVLKKLITTNNLGTYNQDQALAGYAGTFNFDYSLDDFNQLYGIGYFNMLVNEKMIKDLLRDIHDRKIGKPEKAVEDVIFGEI